MQKAEGQSSRLERHFYKNILVDFSLLLLLLLLPLGFFYFILHLLLLLLLPVSPVLESLGMFRTRVFAWSCLVLPKASSPSITSIVVLFNALQIELEIGRSALHFSLCCSSYSVFRFVGRQSMASSSSSSHYHRPKNKFHHRYVMAVFVAMASLLSRRLRCSSWPSTGSSTSLFSPRLCSGPLLVMPCRKKMEREINGVPRFYQSFAFAVNDNSPTLRRASER
jgi:hypothetical protein